MYISAHPQVIQQKSVNYEFCLALSDNIVNVSIHFQMLYELCWRTFSNRNFNLAYTNHLSQHGARGVVFFLIIKNIF